MTPRLWLEPVKETGLSSADTAQASCTLPAPEEAPDNGDDSVTTHTGVTQQCRQWKPEGEGKGNWGLPQMEQESYKAGKSGDFYRADGRERRADRGPKYHQTENFGFLSGRTSWR